MRGVETQLFIEVIEDRKVKMRLKNRVAIVTGSSDGLGRQIALKLAKEGVSLALVARDKEKLEAVIKEAGILGSVKAFFYQCDVRHLDQIKSAVEKIISDFGKIDMLINCAGIWQKKDALENIKENVIEDVIQTNLTGLIHFTRMVLPHLKKQKESAIINISSRSGVTVQENQSVYTASKWGVTGFTEVLKVELKGTGVRVAGIYQGGVNTEMFRKTGEDFNQDHFIKPENLAEVIVFMLSRPPQIWLHDVRVEY